MFDIVDGTIGFGGEKKVVLFIDILKFFLDIKNSKLVHCVVEIVLWEVSDRDVPEETFMFLADMFTFMTSESYLLFKFSTFDSNQIGFYD